MRLSACLAPFASWPHPGVGLLLGVCWLALVGCEKKEPVGTGTQNVQVGIVVVEPKTIPFEIEQIGQTQASQSVEIRTRVQGWLLSRNFQEGARVQADQILFQIDPKPFEADLQIARAQLAQAQASLASADRDVARLSKLYGENAGNRKELDDALTNQLQSRASVQLYQARVTKAELDLSYTTLRSPLHGVIGKTMKDVGSLVDPTGNGLLAKVTQMDPIYVSVTFSEADGLDLADDIQAGRLAMAAGQKRIVVSLKTVDGRPYDKTGLITFKAPEIDPQTGTAQVRAEIPNPDHKLSPGQFVRVKLAGFERPNAITIPQRCVMQAATGAFVYLVNAQGKVETRSVTTAETVGQSWVIDQGLAAGDQVIYDGVQKVRPGMVVSVIPASTTPLGAPSTAPAQLP